MSHHRRSICARCPLVVVSLEPGQWSHIITVDRDGVLWDSERADNDHQAVPIATLVVEVPSG